jgi:hypothetical protein
MAKKKELTQEQIDRKELIDYFSTICSVNINYSALQQTLKKLIDREYTYKGLQYALWYAKEIKGINVISIYMAVYIYEEAKDYYNWRKKMRRVVDNWQLDDKEITVTKKEKEVDIFAL